MIKQRVAVLISGNGSNLQALIDAAADPNYPAEIALVISNKADAYGVKRAKKANIRAELVNHKQFDGREDFDAAMQKILVEHNIDIVCLAGFMRLLSPAFVNGWNGRMLNIHPSLLPEFKGAHAIKDAFEAGVTKTGCSVHYVIPEMDAGEIIAQSEVVIEADDTLETLANKIHAQEHVIYPQALKKVAEKLAG